MQQNAKAALNSIFHRRAFLFSFSTIHGFLFIIVVVETHNITNRLFWESGAKKGRGFRLFFFARVDFFCQQSDLDCL